MAMLQSTRLLLQSWLHAAPLVRDIACVASRLQDVPLSNSGNYRNLHVSAQAWLSSNLPVSPQQQQDAAPKPTPVVPATANYSIVPLDGSIPVEKWVGMGNLTDEERRCHESRMASPAAPNVEEDPGLAVTTGGFDQPLSHGGLLEYLIDKDLLRSQHVVDILAMVDRAEYAHAFHTMSEVPGYEDTAVAIGQGQHMLPPSVHATALQALEAHLTPGARVLDIGSGSGYMLACFGLMVGQLGRVIGVERHERLVSLAVWNIAKTHLALLKQEGGNVEVHLGNALEDDVFDTSQQFDVIHVSASTPEPPPLLLQLLRPGGRMIIPLGDPLEVQVLTAIDMDRGSGELNMIPLGRVRIQPLVPAYADKVPW